jgi:hypothetical protein
MSVPPSDVNLGTGKPTSGASARSSPAGSTDTCSVRAPGLSSCARERDE